VLLADVLREVVQFQPAVVEVFDELPVSVTNRPCGPAPLVRVIGEVPVQRSLAA
jgi:hypothetical protein